jgi:NADPH-dependent curcumin reductase CurA
MSNRRFLLVRRPVGAPVPEDFRLATEPVPAPGPGQVVIRNHYASLDPAQRGWMADEPSYLPPIPLGDAVRATTVGQVHASADPAFVPGDWVLGLHALEDYSVAPNGAGLTKVDVSKVPSPSYFLSAFGAVGLTAYFGITDVLKPKAGETVLVTGAAGAVGSVAGQVARLAGARTIGIAGGPAKCRRLVERYRYDVAIDYKGKSMEALAAEIRAAAPNGVNVVFENVGGPVFDAVLMNLAMYARVGLCGLISEYNSVERYGCRNLWQVLVNKATITGFLILDYFPRFAEGGAQMAKWIAGDQVRVDEHLEHGLENAYAAFMMLFAGKNDGKMVLKIA